MPDGWLPPLMPVLLAHGCLSKEPKASFTPQPVLDNEPPKAMTQKEIKQADKEIRDKKRKLGEVGEGGSGGGRDESDMAKRTNALEGFTMAKEKEVAASVYANELMKHNIEVEHARGLVAHMKDEYKEAKEDKRPRPIGSQRKMLTAPSLSEARRPSPWQPRSVPPQRRLRSQRWRAKGSRGVLGF
mmetsp:Transcript_8110/g.12136  ORF Transcript_8110/g.12136 Transcript_8110/m.12136 type:complete len:186 (+) Transcript_8110:108-665(+)